MRLTKAVLASHLGEKHGTVSNVVPASLLENWSYRELKQEHDRLCRLGPCSLSPTIKVVADARSLAEVDGV